MFGKWSEQGAREYQEDRAICHQLREHEAYSGHKQAVLIGVFDGHAGAEAAVYLQENLAKHFLERPLQQLIDQPHESLRDALLQCDRELCLRNVSAGSTAVVALQLDSHIYICNIGDSRALMVARGKSESRQLTTDHNTHEPSEKARLCEAGADIDRNGYLHGEIQVSRDIGSAHLKCQPIWRPWLLAEPEMVHLEAGSDDVALVLFSDGVADVYSNWWAGSKVRAALGKGAERAAKVLAKGAAKRGARSSDNVTVVVLRLQR